MAKLALCSLILLPLSLAGTIALLIGCMSPGVRDLGIYYVNITELAEELVNLSANSTHKTSDLLHPQLPTHWFFGFSGICDLFADEPEPHQIRGPPPPRGKTTCRRAFPLKTDILSVLEDSLRAATNDSYPETETTIATVVSAWQDVLDDTPPSKLVDKQSRVASQAKATVALAVVSVILDFVNLGVALTDNIVVVCVIGVISTAMGIAAGACAILVMNDGMHGIVGRGDVSVSLACLFVASLLKVPAFVVFLVLPALLAVCFPCLGPVLRILIFWG